MSPDRDRDWSQDWDEDWSDDSDEHPLKPGRRKERGATKKEQMNDWGDGARGRQKHSWRRPRYED